MTPAVATLDRPTAASAARLGFALPPALEAHEPPEARGLSRDAVRLMVARGGDPEPVHSTFSHLPQFLAPGDLVVVNTSGTMPAALRAHDPARDLDLVVHLSTEQDDGHWVVEPRQIEGKTTGRWSGDAPGPRLLLEGGAVLTLVEPYGEAGRLWLAEISTPGPFRSWLADHGRPIRYGYIDRHWPIEAYQNVYATDQGSAEMPSAGRPITTEIITRLVAKGVAVAPLRLDTGVASLEADELPYPERVRVPRATARLVNATHRAGRRVVAVGTTVVRALESASDLHGVVSPFSGWTDLVITPAEGVRVVDGLLTGWHEPEASHLLLLEAVAGRALLRVSYDAAIAHGYLWHEFGDSHLLLP
jgi:S-adenosylmethionine:tRNA ribosyltransferase-isomerase